MQRKIFFFFSSFFNCLPGGSDGKESACNAADPGSVSDLGRSSGEGNGYLWTARRSNQSILKEISPEYLLEGLMLKLKLQFFGHLMQRTDSLEKTLILGKIEGGRRRG